MAKIYTKKNVASQNMLPKKSTISFILNYSKALKIIQLGNMKFEIIAN
jgi:hypothetical protein